MGSCFCYACLVILERGPASRSPGSMTRSANATVFLRHWRSTTDSRVFPPLGPFIESIEFGATDRSYKFESGLKAKLCIDRM
jgi:hypothetical protein